MPTSAGLDKSRKLSKISQWQSEQKMQLLPPKKTPTVQKVTTREVQEIPSPFTPHSEVDLCLSISWRLNYGSN
jgi:hypothetical protein